MRLSQAFPVTLFSNQVFGHAAVFVELWVENDEVDAAEPEGEVVVAERRGVAGDRLRSWSVALEGTN